MKDLYKDLLSRPCLIRNDLSDCVLEYKKMPSEYETMD